MLLLPGESQTLSHGAPKQTKQEVITRVMAGASDFSSCFHPILVVRLSRGASSERLLVHVEIRHLSIC